MNETESTVGKWKPARSVQLPEGWRWTTIGDVARDTQIGIVRSKAQQNREGQGVPYLKMNNLTMSGKVTTDDIVFVQATQDEIDRYALRGGDILFNTRNSIELVGKTGIVTQGASGFIYNNNLMRIRTKPNVLPLFIAYQMCSPDFRNRMERVKRSTTNVAALYAKDVLPLPIALAPVDQQSFIVAEIEKQFSRLDEAIANLKRVKANLKRYKAAVLKAAVKGKLTEEWRKAHPDAEPASELLKRILAERRAKWDGKVKYKEPAGPDATKLPPLPHDWVYASVEQLGIVGEQAVLTGPFGTNLGHEDFTEAGVPVLTISCLKETGIDLAKVDFVSEEKAQELERYRLKAGDLLFSRMASVGRAGIVGEALKRALFNYHIMRLRLEPTVLVAKYYMAYVRGSTQVNLYIRDVNHGATRDGINTEQLLNMPVAMPPLAEQEQIVEEVERRLSVVEELEAVVAANFQRTVRLRQAVLHNAFSGRLFVTDS